MVIIKTKRNYYNLSPSTTQYKYTTAIISFTLIYCNQMCAAKIVYRRNQWI